MTTTLRPSGPEERTADGTRSRAYAICDNARTVGTVQLATDVRYGPSAGRVAGLSVELPERRRGRATVAMLAAEEVLRGWGCDRIAICVPATAEGALDLATALGYTERNRMMIKPLTGEPRLPAGSSTRPLTHADFAEWSERDGERQADVLLARGVPAAQVAARTARDQAALLPDGPRTAGMHMRALVHDGADVGILWLCLSGAPGAGADTWVYGVEVEESRRGRGHGRTLMLAAERACLGAGARSLGLNVYVANAPALRLYESLGYRTAEHHLSKHLP